MSILKYGYQAYFLNEYDKLQLECMSEIDPRKTCNPVEEFNSPQGLTESLAAMAIFMVSFYLIAFGIMLKKSKEY